MLFFLSRSRCWSCPQCSKGAHR